MYWNVWVSVAASRFSLYGGISFFIYQGRDSMVASVYGGSEAAEGLGRIKSRVVFTFCFMEMMTWFWVCFPLSLWLWLWVSTPFGGCGDYYEEGLTFFSALDLRYSPPGTTGEVDQAT